MLQCWRRTGYLPSYFVPTPGDLTAQESPPPGICHPNLKNSNAWGSARGGGGGAKVRAGRSWNWLMHYVTKESQCNTNNCCRGKHISSLQRGFWICIDTQDNFYSKKFLLVWSVINTCKMLNSSLSVSGLQLYQSRKFLTTFTHESCWD